MPTDNGRGGKVLAVSSRQLPPLDQEPGDADLHLERYVLTDSAQGALCCYRARP